MIFHGKMAILNRLLSEVFYYAKGMTMINRRKTDTYLLQRYGKPLKRQMAKWIIVLIVLLALVTLIVYCAAEEAQKNYDQSIETEGTYAVGESIPKVAIPLPVIKYMANARCVL